MLPKRNLGEIFVIELFEQRELKRKKTGLVCREIRQFFLIILLDAASPRCHRQSVSLSELALLSISSLLSSNKTVASSLSAFASSEKKMTKCFLMQGRLRFFLSWKIALFPHSPPAEIRRPPPIYPAPHPRRRLRCTPVVMQHKRRFAFFCKKRRPSPIRLFPMLIVQSPQLSPSCSRCVFSGNGGGGGTVVLSRDLPQDREGTSGNFFCLDI